MSVYPQQVFQEFFNEIQTKKRIPNKDWRFIIIQTETTSIRIDFDEMTLMKKGVRFVERIKINIWKFESGKSPNSSGEYSKFVRTVMFEDFENYVNVFDVSKIFDMSPVKEVYGSQNFQTIAKYM
jgi:hypothetical protein